MDNTNTFDEGFNNSFNNTNNNNNSSTTLESFQTYTETPTGLEEVDEREYEIQQNLETNTRF